MKVLIDDHAIDPRQIAALTPYSAQREEIRKQMKKQRVTGVQVKTITESQGKQARGTLQTDYNRMIRSV